MPEASSDPPESSSSLKDPWTIRAKAWGTVIAAVGGLVTASAAILKPRDDSATKGAYVELSKGLEKLSTETTQNHDDLAALRGYLAAKEGAPVLSLALPGAAPATVDAGAAGALAPLVRPTKVGVAPRPKVVHLSDVVVVGALGSVGAAAASTPDLPEVHPAPAPVHAADFGEVLKSAR